MSKPINFKYSNTLINTRQPIVNIKGTNTDNNMEPVSVGIVGGMSRPNVNLGHAPSTSPEVNYNNARNFIGPFAKAYPIKHWRRQLISNGKSSNSHASISVIDRPGGTVFRGYTKEGCDCDASGNNIYITYDNKFLQSDNKSIKPSGTINILPGTVNNKVQNNGGIQIGPVGGNGSYEIQTGIYNTKSLCSTPEKNNVIKSAVTMLSKSYYSDSKAYLKSRCKTYDQKLSIQEISGNTYDSELIANNSVEFATNNCTKPYQIGRNCKNTTIYKPNNMQFATQGAVDNGTRLAKLKYDTITKNGASFRTALGEAAASAGKYHGSTGSPYFIKSKYSAKMLSRRNGNKTVCNTSKKDGTCGPSQTLSSFWGAVN